MPRHLMPRDPGKVLHDPSSTELRSRGPEASGEALLTGLTVLYHPDLRRVGERTLLSPPAPGQPMALSRHTPGFAAPGATTEPRPLAHRRLSRRPWLLENVAGGVRLRRAGSRTQLVAEGQPVAEETTFTAGEVDRGVVLLLGGRVVLLLHRLKPFIDPGLPRFGLLGESPAIIDLRHHVRQVADLEVSVLLRGESGTGKELVAEALHRASPRRGGPFVAVNMAAVPPSLAAAELFGAARGAFTGADKRRDGYFARADGGTLFLDEVGEAPVEVQTLLLRALESGEIQPVGEARPRRVDVRLLAATDTDLQAAVAGGRFRAPLLYRLSGFEIILPPLRDRREDVGRLLIEFLRRELETVGEERRLDADPPWLPAELVARLAAASWPGNVRQLRNVVRQLVIVHRGRDRVHPGALDTLLSGPTPPSTPRSGAVAQRAEVTARKPSDVTEEELVAALRAQRWRPHAAARQLGIPRPSIYNLIKKSPRLRTAADLGRADLEDARRRLGDDVAAMAADLEVSETALRRRLGQLGRA